MKSVLAGVSDDDRLPKFDIEQIYLILNKALRERSLFTDGGGRTRVFRKQRCTATLPATQVTYAVYFFEFRFHLKGGPLGLSL